MAAVQEAQNEAGAEKVAAPAVVASFTGLKPQLLVEAPKASEDVMFYKTAFLQLNSRLSAPLSFFLTLSMILLLWPRLWGPDVCSVWRPRTWELPSLKSSELVLDMNVEIVEVNGACYGGRMGKVKDPYCFGEKKVDVLDAKKVEDDELVTESKEVEERSSCCCCFCRSLHFKLSFQGVLKAYRNGIPRSAPSDRELLTLH